MKYFYVYPARHFVTPESARKAAIASIKEELDETLPTLGLIEAHRLRQRTNFDLEMIQETGSCKGIENYSRHFDGRKAGEKPYCLLDYFPDDFLMIIDESHQTIPQLHGMYNGDRSRKKTLVNYGFRLPSSARQPAPEIPRVRAVHEQGDLCLGNTRALRITALNAALSSRLSGPPALSTRRLKSGPSRDRRTM